MFSFVAVIDLVADGDCGWSKIFIIIFFFGFAFCFAGGEPLDVIVAMLIICVAVHMEQISKVSWGVVTGLATMIIALLILLVADVIALVISTSTGVIVVRFI